MTGTYVLRATRALVALALTAAVAHSARPAHAQAIGAYDVALLGLTGAEWTDNANRSSASPQFYTDLGVILGYSKRYNGGSSELGQSAWYYDPITGTLSNIGLTGPEFTSNTAYRYSNAKLVNAAGQVMGVASRYNGGSASLGTAIWHFDPATGMTRNIGLAGTEFTRNDGVRNSNADALNAAGQVIGGSYRYDGGSIDLGHSSWLYNPTTATTTVIGVTGPEFTRDDGYSYNWAAKLNDAGQVLGTAHRFNGGSIGMGDSIWFFDPSTGATRDISLTAAEFTRNDGYRSNFAALLTAAGQVIGYAARYNGGSTYMGQSAWYYSPAAGTTRDISLTGTEFTRNDGYRYSNYSVLNAAGQAFGTADRYNGGSTYLGVAAWFYDPATGATHNISLTGTEFTRNDGYRVSAPDQLNAAGQILGHAERYNGGSTYLGPSAWFYNPSTATTTTIGLTGAQFTRDDGLSNNTAVALSPGGQVIGKTQRYSGSNSMGLAAWFYDPATSTTREISLTTTEFTRTDGYRYSVPALLNASGQAAGYANRYDPQFMIVDLGQSAWFYNPATATVTSIGPTGTEFTRSDYDYRFSSPTQINAAGQVLGVANRYSGTTDLGQVPWLFNPATATTYPLRFSIATGGQAATTVRELTDSGTVVGYYTLYSGSTALGNRAFFWNPADGFFDLGSQVVGGLAAAGLTALTDVSDITPAGLVTGQAASANGGNMGYQLSYATVRFAPGAGAWQTPASWVGSIAPAAPNRIVFNASSSASLSANATVRAANILAAGVTWNLAGHTLAISDTLNIGDPLTTPTASLHASGGTVTLGFDLTIYPHATLAGDAIFNASITNHGALSPGNSPGTLTIDGAYIQASDGSFLIELQGTSPGQFDLLDIDGSAALSGLLEVHLLNGFTPVAGETFTILTASHGISGSFSRFDLPPLSQPVDRWSVVYTTNEVHLAVVTPEPVSLAILTLPAAALLLRRRRRRHTGR